MNRGELAPYWPEATGRAWCNTQRKNSGAEAGKHCWEFARSSEGIEILPENIQDRLRDALTQNSVAPRADCPKNYFAGESRAIGNGGISPRRTRTMERSRQIVNARLLRIAATRMGVMKLHCCWVGSWRAPGALRRLPYGL